jgi:tetratricopeptide (TPR) repeat protein
MRLHCSGSSCHRNFLFLYGDDIIETAMPAGTNKTQPSAEDYFYDAIDHVSDASFDEAIVAFRACLELDPTYLDAMHGLIRALQHSGRLDEAISVALRLSEMDPDDVLAHTSLSILYQHKGLIPEAEAEALKAKLLGWKHQLRQKSAEEV